MYVFSFTFGFKKSKKFEAYEEQVNKENHTNQLARIKLQTYQHIKIMVTIWVF